MEVTLQQIKELLYQLQFVPQLVYYVVFIVIFFEHIPLIGLIMPGTLIIFLAGFLAPMGLFNMWYVFIAAFSAAFLADIVNYIFGRNVFPAWHKSKLLEKTYIMKHAESFYQKHDEQSMFLARFVGPIRPFAAWVAGRHKMYIFDFWFYSLFGAIFWTAFLLSLGYFMATSFDLVTDRMDYYGLLVSFVIIILYFLYHRRKLVKKIKKIID